MTTSSQARDFSSVKHKAGQWNTSIIDYRNPVARFLLSYMSYKRRGVDNLAKKTPANGLVLDAGAGKGAYCRWFLGRNSSLSVIAADWSFEALRAIQPARHGLILRVCADLQRLPFKSGCFDALYSIDTLGHVPRVETALDEFSRVCKENSLLFIHSECSDYREKWPDRKLILKLEKDLPAEMDGHISLYKARELYAFYSGRFVTGSFINPAGYTGWLTGHPEKYKQAFADANFRFSLYGIKTVLILKKIWPINICIKLFNALTNHLETFMGLKGGGSCFAELRKP
jgi:ubiquinone/menaquinone biosynthesis C-methylase UbiE